MFLMDLMLALVAVLLSVAFFTLMERKVMGLMHYRKGPNKTLIQGMTQPIADALKLLTKENLKMSPIKTSMYTMGPTLALVLMVFYWMWYDFCFNCSSSTLKMMMIFTVMSLTAYGLITMSWGSNTKYSLIGGHRAVAQIISYEVCLMLYALVVVFTTKSYSMEKITGIQQGFWVMLMTVPLFLTWMLLCMAETNRTPFDLAEGESEIVSGFNIEYGGGLFALIFISEYGMIIFLSFFTSEMFMASQNIMAKTFIVCMVFVWVRSSFPRIRYDNLMMMSWKMALPMSLASLMLAGCMV